MAAGTLVRTRRRMKVNYLDQVSLHQPLVKDSFLTFPHDTLPHNCEENIAFIWNNKNNQYRYPGLAGLYGHGRKDVCQLRRAARERRFRG